MTIGDANVGGAFDARWLTPGNCRFTKSASGLLRVEVADEFCCLRAVLRRLFPVRMPDSHVSVGDGGGREVGIIEALSDFDPDTRRLIEEELDYYYAVPVIVDIHHIRDEYGFYRWDTTTDRGRRGFYVKGRTDNVTRAADRGMFITDVHDCRYRIDDIRALSRASMAWLQKVL